MNSTTPEALILDLIEWVAARERTYEDTMDAWRTSCPRLTVWEDSIDRGLITVEQHDRKFFGPCHSGRPRSARSKQTFLGRCTS